MSLILYLPPLSVVRQRRIYAVWEIYALVIEFMGQE